MRRNRFLENERKLAAERKIKYKGTASIRTEVLDFPNEELDTENTKRLGQFFRDVNGCSRLDPLDHIPALIDQNHLNAALAASGITAEQLLVSPRETYLSLEFPPGFQLNCLRGRDQVQAGVKILPPGDKRWTVDLYLAGMIYFIRH
jgi:hypothetical protein